MVKCIELVYPSSLLSPRKVFSSGDICIIIIIPSVELLIKISKSNQKTRSIKVPRFFMHTHSTIGKFVFPGCPKKPYAMADK